MYGKRVSADLLAWAVGALAAGLGIRAVARVFEVDANTVLAWLVEAAEHLQAFSPYFGTTGASPSSNSMSSMLCSARSKTQRARGRGHQAPVAFPALGLGGDRSGEEAAAGHRGRPPHAGHGPELVPQVVRLLAPDCVPLFLTDGFKAYITALLTHCGQWETAQRRQAKGPLPKPRWMPLPQLLYAQVIKVTRRRRLVEVKHRVVFGTKAAVEQVLVACGWRINTAFIERVPSASANLWRRSAGAS